MLTVRLARSWQDAGLLIWELQNPLIRAGYRRNLAILNKGTELLLANA